MRLSRPVLETAAVAGSLTLGLMMASACFGPGPPPQMPTEYRVAATARSVGIPYGPWVLFRSEDRYTALRVTIVSTIGNRIEYEWVSPEPGSIDFSAAPRYRGEAEEGSYVGQLNAAPLILTWSRGSKELGWVYWPDNDVDLSVCSRTFPNLESIKTEGRGQAWYTQESFK